MAKRRRKSSTSGSTKRRTSRRRRRNPGNPSFASAPKRRRTRRRRRNPGIDIAGLGVAALGAVAVAAAHFALDQTTVVTNGQQTAITGLGGAALGAGLSFLSRPLGMGVAGGAIAIGAYEALKEFMETKPTTSGIGCVPFAGCSPAELVAATRESAREAAREELGAIVAELPSGQQSQLGAVVAQHGSNVMRLY